jgi:hypothetical protein
MLPTHAHIISNYLILNSFPSLQANMGRAEERGVPGVSLGGLRSPHLDCLGESATTEIVEELGLSTYIMATNGKELAL